MTDWDLEDRFAIIVGHSHDKQGAQAVWPLELSEYEYNKDLALQCWKNSKSIGLDAAIFLRDGKTISQLGREVNSWCWNHNACAIELHFDWFTQNAVQGTTTLYDMVPHNSLDFAHLVQEKVSKVFGRVGKNDRGTRWVKMKDRGYYNLYVLEVPACIIEPGFGSNHYDCALLKDRVQEYSKALAEVANDFLKKERENNYGKSI
jgi:N-acetylmuramoyl-L-alanine amidase